MTDLILKRGQKVSYLGKQYRIESPISLDQILLKDPETSETINAKIPELAPANNTKQDARENIADLLLISDSDWEVAKHREAVFQTFKIITCKDW